MVRLLLHLLGGVSTLRVGHARGREGGAQVVEWVLGVLHALKLHAILATTAVAFWSPAALDISAQHSTACILCVPQQGGLTKQT